MNRKIKKIAFDILKDGSLEVDVCAIPDWDGFDKLIRFFKKEARCSRARGNHCVGQGTREDKNGLNHQDEPRGSWEVQSR